MVIDQDWLPPTCGNVTYTIDAKTVTSRSGSLIIAASYEAEKVRDRYVLRLADIAATGGVNCQGVPRESVMSHFMEELTVAVVDGRLRTYFPQGAYTDHVKVTSED